MNVLKPLGAALLILILLLIVSGLFGTYLLKQDQPQMFADPVLEDSPLAFEIDSRPLLIVYSKTNGYRHRDAIGEGIKLFSRFAADNDWQVIVTENGSVFTDTNLADTAAVVFNNSTGPLANATQQRSLRNYLKRGGGILAVHAAGDGSHRSWPWYQDEVIRARFTSAARFPPQQQATITIHNTLDKIVSHLPKEWSLTDEWYSFARPPTQVDVLASLEEDSYQAWPFGMGNEHPIIWRHSNLGGRVLYIGPGHRVETFQHEGYQSLLRKALLWVAASAK